MILSNIIKECPFKWHSFYNIFLSFLFLLISCTKEVKIDIGNEQKQMVINSIFSPDKPIYIKFSNTAPVLNSYELINDSLHVIMRINDKTFIDDEIFSQDLQTNIISQSNATYSLEVRSKNFPILYARDTLPTLVYIDNATLRSHVATDEFGSTYSEVSISFTDPSYERNYYELLIADHAEQNPIYWLPQNLETEITDPVLLNEGDIDYKPTTFFFSDELFNGRSYTMRITGLSASDPVFTVYLRSVSRNYYLYRKYYTRHANNQQLKGDFLDVIFMGEPQSMFTNIVNGFGIFACYNETSMKINDIIEPHAK